MVSIFLASVLNSFYSKQIAWKHPLKLDASMLTLAEKGASSKEKELQREREKNVLAVLVFDQNAMVESPKEPDMEVITFFFIFIDNVMPCF